MLVADTVNLSVFSSVEKSQHRKREREKKKKPWTSWSIYCLLGPHFGFSSVDSTWTVSPPDNCIEASSTAIIKASSKPPQDAAISILWGWFVCATQKWWNIGLIHHLPMKHGIHTVQFTSNWRHSINNSGACRPERKIYRKDQNF